jgi:microcompartment protein CcmL/EutN
MSWKLSFDTFLKGATVRILDSKQVINGGHKELKCDGSVRE